jgi:hypothetical protein
MKGRSRGRRRGLRLNVHQHVLRALKGLSRGLRCGLRHAGQVRVAFLNEVRHQEGNEGAEEHLSTQSHVDMSGSKCGGQMGPAADDRSKLNKAWSASTSADGGRRGTVSRTIQCNASPCGRQTNSIWLGRWRGAALRCVALCWHIRLMLQPVRPPMKRPFGPTCPNPAISQRSQRERTVRSGQFRPICEVLPNRDGRIGTSQRRRASRSGKGRGGWPPSSARSPPRPCGPTPCGHRSFGTRVTLGSQSPGTDLA